MIFVMAAAVPGDGRGRDGGSGCCREPEGGPGERASGAVMVPTHGQAACRRALGGRRGPGARPGNVLGHQRDPRRQQRLHPTWAMPRDGRRCQLECRRALGVGRPRATNGRVAAQAMGAGAARGAHTGDVGGLSRATAARRQQDGLIYPRTRPAPRAAQPPSAWLSRRRQGVHARPSVAAAPGLAAQAPRRLPGLPHGCTRTATEPAQRPAGRQSPGCCGGGRRASGRRRAGRRRRPQQPASRHHCRHKQQRAGRHQQRHRQRKCGTARHTRPGGCRPRGAAG